MSVPLVSGALAKGHVCMCLSLQMRNVPSGRVNTMNKCFMTCSSSGTDPESGGGVPGETTKTSFNPLELDFSTLSDETNRVTLASLRKSLPILL